MMDYSEQQIGDIEKYAALFFTPREIAILIDVDQNKLHTDVMVAKSSMASRAYFKGKLLQEAKIRENVMNLCYKNSTTAQEQVFELIKKQQKYER